MSHKKQLTQIDTFDHTTGLDGTLITTAILLQENLMVVKHIINCLATCKCNILDNIIHIIYRL